MQCPKCQREDFETDKPCPQCGFQGDANRPDELGHHQMDEREKFSIDAAPVSRLKETHTSHPRDTQVALESRLPAFTPEEAEKAWIELARLETLFGKVDEWRTAGYFKKEMESLDPVKAQRAHADELRQRLEEYQRPESPRTDPDRLKTVGFLLDNIDLLASRQWFKSKKAIEKIVGPIMAMMVDAISGNDSE